MTMPKFEPVGWLGTATHPDDIDGEESVVYCFSQEMATTYRDESGYEIEPHFSEDQLTEAYEAGKRDALEIRYRYVQQVKNTIHYLVGVARAADRVMDGNEEGNYINCSEDAAIGLSFALGELETLPDDKPGYTLSGPARAEWALRNLDYLADQDAIPEGIRESVAKAIYAQWRDNPHYVPWVEGGNSLMQDSARHIAAAALESAAPKGEE